MSFVLADRSSLRVVAVLGAMVIAGVMGSMPARTAAAAAAPRVAVANPVAGVTRADQLRNVRVGIVPSNNSAGYAWNRTNTSSQVSVTFVEPTITCDGAKDGYGSSLDLGILQSTSVGGQATIYSQNFCVSTHPIYRFDLEIPGIRYNPYGFGSASPGDVITLTDTVSSSGTTVSYSDATNGQAQAFGGTGASLTETQIGGFLIPGDVLAGFGQVPFSKVADAGASLGQVPDLVQVNWDSTHTIDVATSNLSPDGTGFTMTRTNLPGPTISGVKPNHGRAKGGTHITIHGTGFGSPGDNVAVDLAPSGGTAMAATKIKVLSDTRIKAVTPDARGQMTNLHTLLTDVQVNAGGITTGNSAADQFTYQTCGHGGSTKSGMIAVTESAGKDEFGVCPLYVKITDAGGTISPGLATSGISWLGSHNIGFKDEDGGIFQPNGIFIDTCVSGCLNILATVTDSYGQPVPDADLTATVHPLTHDVINPGGGEAGHICGAANQLSGGNRDGPCGTSIMVKTASGSPGAGQVTLRYWAPAVWVGTDKYGHDLPYPKATITFQATAHSCGGSTCFSQKSKPTDADFEIKPHPFFQQNAVLTSTERDVLVQWAENGSITTDLKAFDKELSKLKVFAPLLKKSWLHKFVNLLPYYDQMADLVIMELFDRKFGFVEDGLTNLNVHDLTTKLISYIKGESKAGKGVKKVLEWLQKKLFGVPHDYAGQLIDTLKKYAGTGGLESESASIKHLMTLKAYEASFCKGTECRGPVPALPLSNGTYYNLLVAFSSEDAQAPGSDIFFNKFNVDTGYAAPTWIPEQCLSHVDAQTKTYNGCLDNPGG